MPSIGPDDAARHPGQIGQASAALFTGLVDDASMFPPGNAPLDQAVREHLEHRGAWYAGLVGPLVVRADHMGEAADLVAAQPLPAPTAVSVVAPEGLAQARDG